MSTRRNNSEGKPSSEEHVRSIFRSRLLIWSGILLFLIAAGGVFFYRLREEGRSDLCRNHLEQIGQALRGYHQIHGSFPSAFVCDKAGKPVNSWRTVVVSGFWYILRPGPQNSVNEPGYDYEEPWNGPNNARHGYGELDKVRAWPFQCPSAAGSEEPAITNYVAVVGPNTMWPGFQPAKQAADGSDRDKILVIEVINSDILWMEPRDLTLEQALDTMRPRKGIGIGGRHRDGIHYVTVGGAVRTLDRNIDRESLRMLLVREGLGSGDGFGSDHR